MVPTAASRYAVSGGVLHRGQIPCIDPLKEDRYILRKPRILYRLPGQQQVNRIINVKRLINEGQVDGDGYNPEQ